MCEVVNVVTLGSYGRKFIYISRFFLFGSLYQLSIPVTFIVLELQWCSLAEQQKCENNANKTWNWVIHGVCSNCRKNTVHVGPRGFEVVNAWKLCHHARLHFLKRDSAIIRACIFVPKTCATLINITNTVLLK